MQSVPLTGAAAHLTLRHLNHGILLLALAALLPVGLVSGYAIHELRLLTASAQAQSVEARRTALNAVFEIGVARAAGEIAAHAERRHPDDLKVAREALATAAMSVGELKSLVGRGLDTTVQQRVVARQDELLALMKEGFTAAESLSTSRDQASTRRVLEPIRAAEPFAATLFRDLAASRDAQLVSDTRATGRSGRALIAAIAASLLVPAAIFGLLAAFVRRFVVKPMDALSRAAAAVAGGDFTQSVAVTAADELGRLQGAFNRMMGDLRAQRERAEDSHRQLMAAMERSQRNEERLSLALDGSSLVAWDWDIAADAFHVDESWALLGGRGDEASVMGVTQFLAQVHASDQAALQSHLLECAAGRSRTVQTAFRIATVTGDTRWIQAHGKVTGRDERGTAALRMTGTFADITQHRRADDELRQSETRYRQIADHIPGVLMLRSADAKEIIYLSRRCEDVWGRTRDSLCRRPSTFIDGVHPDDRTRLLKAMEPLLSGTACHVEYRVVRPDGSERWVWERASPILDETGAVCRVVSVAEDITERKAAEQALRESRDRPRSMTGTREGSGVEERGRVARGLHDSSGR